MSTARVLTGVALVLLGISFLFDQFGLGHLFFFDDLLGTFWPLILVAIGVSALGKNNTTTGLIFIVLGSLFQISELFDVNVFRLFWPIVIILAGASILYKGSIPHDFSSSTPADADEINDSVTFWGLDKKVTAQHFKGGTVNCLFGGIQLDLRQIHLAETGATLEVSCHFGGIEIRVPESMRVIVQGDAIFGGWENHFSTNTDESLPLLTIRGSVAFGGVQVKN